jgi:hypothetical protein
MAIRDVRNVTDGQSFSMSLGQTHGFGWGGENFDSKIEEWKSERRNRNGRFLSYLGFGPQVTEFEKHLASNNAKDIAVTLEAFKKLKRDYGGRCTQQSEANHSSRSIRGIESSRRPI